MSGSPASLTTRILWPGGLQRLTLLILQYTRVVAAHKSACFKNSAALQN